MGRRGAQPLPTVSAVPKALYSAFKKRWKRGSLRQRRKHLGDENLRRAVDEGNIFLIFFLKNDERKSLILG